jgi:hypothetical protein
MADHLRRIEVYPHLSNNAAFIDKVVIEVRGTRRKKSLRKIMKECNLAIGGPGRYYARCIRGTQPC